MHQQWARAIPDVTRAAPDVATPPRTSLAPLATSYTHPMCNTRSILKYPDVTFVTYKRRQMKHLKQASETLAKTPEKN
jgi:hypothetical protein